jgi:hypothetical protein
VGKRSRQRERGRQARPAAPTADYADAEGNVLTLRGAMTPATRREYAGVLAGDARPAATREDAWQRGVEFLFERLATSWTIAGVETTGQRELLQRFRFANADERQWIRDVLREHLAEWFPELQAP